MLPEPKPLRPAEWAVRWAVTAAYLGLILTLNRLPPKSDFVESVNTLPFGDKFGHLGEYGGLAFLLVVLCRLGRTGWTSAAAVVAGLSMLAALDELTQPWWDRTCDVWDWAADTVAAVLGVIAGRVWLALISGRTATSATR